MVRQALTLRPVSQIEQVVQIALCEGQKKGPRQPLPAQKPLPAATGEAPVHSSPIPIPQ